MSSVHLPASLWYSVHSRTTGATARGPHGLFPAGPAGLPFHDEIIFGFGNEVDYAFIKWLPGLTLDCQVDPSRIHAEISLAGSAFQAVSRWPALFSDLAALADHDRSVDAVASILEQNGFIDASP